MVGSGSTCEVGDVSSSAYTSKTNTYTDVLDDKVIEDERVAGRADAEAETCAAEIDSEPQLLAPCTVKVRHGFDLRDSSISGDLHGGRIVIAHLVLDLLHARPAAEDE